MRAKSGRHTRTRKSGDDPALLSLRDIFTGVGVHWLLLPPGSAVVFERKDVSDKGGEHATTVYLNTEPEHKNRIELISNTYRPLKRVMLRK